MTDKWTRLKNMTKQAPNNWLTDM